MHPFHVHDPQRWALDPQIWRGGLARIHSHCEGVEDPPDPQPHTGRLAHLDPNVDHRNQTPLHPHAGNGSLALRKNGDPHSGTGGMAEFHPHLGHDENLSDPHPVAHHDPHSGTDDSHPHDLQAVGGGGEDSVDPQHSHGLHC